MTLSKAANDYLIRNGKTLEPDLKALLDALGTEEFSLQGVAGIAHGLTQIDSPVSSLLGTRELRPSRRLSSVNHDSEILAHELALALVESAQKYSHLRVDSIHLLDALLAKDAATLDFTLAPHREAEMAALRNSPDWLQLKSCSRSEASSDAILHDLDRFSRFTIGQVQERVHSYLSSEYYPFTREGFENFKSRDPQHPSHGWTIVWFTTKARFCSGGW